MEEKTLLNRIIIDPKISTRSITPGKDNFSSPFVLSEAAWLRS